MSALRTLNLALYALLEEKITGYATSAIEKFDIATELVTSNLMSYTQQYSGSPIEFSSIDPNQTECLAQAFLNIRLYFLVAKLAASLNEDMSEHVRILETTYWRGLWPALERVLMGNISMGRTTVRHFIASVSNCLY